jgi:predicted MFS family arabinose efflux permease
MGEERAMHGANQRRMDAVIVILAIFVVTLAVNLQVPLYKAYADIAGYRQGRVSVTFAAYVAGLLPVLLLLGGFAGRYGNKLALLLGLGFAFAGHAVILVSPTIQALLVTRVLQGISIGLSLAAGTAYLAEATPDPARAARLSGAAVTLGLGSGGLITSAGLAVQRSLAPPSYHAVAIATLACAVAMLRVRARRPGSGQSLIRRPLISNQTFPLGVSIFLSWSLTGIILATVPPHLAHAGHEGWSGLVVFVAIASGLSVQLRTRLGPPLHALRIGYALVAAALALLIVALHEGSSALLLFASALSGLSSFGFTYVGGLTGTLLACPDERARATSGYYLLGYLGFGLPCIGVGYMADRWGLEAALVAYGAAILVAFSVWRAGRSFIGLSPVENQ